LLLLFSASLVLPKPLLAAESGLAQVAVSITAPPRDIESTLV
jgi:hypothetical protein